MPVYSLAVHKSDIMHIAELDLDKGKTVARCGTKSKGWIVSLSEEDNPNLKYCKRCYKPVWKVREMMNKWK